MATWNNIIDNVGDELGLDNYKSTGADVSTTQRVLNRTLQHILQSHSFTWYISATPQSFNTVAGTTEYTLSAFLDIIAMYISTGDSQSYAIPEKTLHWYIKHWANVDFVASDKPDVYARLDLYDIKVAPRPDAIYTINVYYTPAITDFATFTANITVPERVQDVLETGMLSRMYRYLHEYDIARELKNDYALALLSLIKEDKDNPNLIFRKQPFLSAPAYNTQYWKNHFV